MTKTNRLEVMQADRDAAADIWRDYVARIGEVMAEKAIRSGAMDDGSLVQTFVAHRIETNSRTGDTVEGSGASASPTVATHEPSPSGLGPTGECQLAGFIKEIHDRTPNGEWICVQHHPNGDWSVAEEPE